MKDIFTYEEMLLEWQEGLPKALDPQSSAHQATAGTTGVQDEHTFTRMRLILRLRYLNVRIILHRPVISHMLRQNLGHAQRDSPARVDSFVQATWESSMNTCLVTAMEVIDVVHKASTNTTMLGSWWFALYYSESCRTLQTGSTTLTTALAFTASLIIYSCVLLNLRPRYNAAYQPLPAHKGQHSTTDLIGKLRLANEAVQKIGNDTALGSRVQSNLLEHVNTLISLCKSSSASTQTMSNLRTAKMSRLREYEAAEGEQGETLTATAPAAFQADSTQQDGVFNGELMAGIPSEFDDMARDWALFNFDTFTSL